MTTRSPKEWAKLLLLLLALATLSGCAGSGPTAVKTPAPTPTCVDQYEVAGPDGLGTGIPVIANNTAMTRNFSIKDEADWVKFTLADAQLVTIATSSLDPDVDTKIALYNEGNKPMVGSDKKPIENDDDAETQPASRFSVVLSKGTYLVKVTNQNGRGGCWPAYRYTIGIGVDPAPTPTITTTPTSSVTPRVAASNTTAPATPTLTRTITLTPTSTRASQVTTLNWETHTKDTGKPFAFVSHDGKKAAILWQPGQFNTEKFSGVTVITGTNDGNMWVPAEFIKEGFIMPPNNSAASASKNCPKTHKVDLPKDIRLFDIAKKYGSTVRDIAVANPQNLSNPNQLKDGVNLNIAGCGLKNIEVPLTVGPSVDSHWVGSIYGRLPVDEIKRENNWVLIRPKDGWVLSKE